MREFRVIDMFWVGFAFWQGCCVEWICTWQKSRRLHFGFFIYVLYANIIHINTFAGSLRNTVLLQLVVVEEEELRVDEGLVVVVFAFGQNCRVAAFPCICFRLTSRSVFLHFLAGLCFLVIPLGRISTVVHYWCCPPLSRQATGQTCAMLLTSFWRTPALSSSEMRSLDACSLLINTKHLLQYFSKHFSRQGACVHYG